MNFIDINNIDKAELFAGLYNKANAFGNAASRTYPDGMSVEQAQQVINSRKRTENKPYIFEIFDRKCLWLDLSGNTLQSGPYDSVYGQGAAHAVVAAIRAEQPQPTRPTFIPAATTQEFLAAHPK